MPYRWAIAVTVSPRATVCVRVLVVAVAEAVRAAGSDSVCPA